MQIEVEIPPALGGGSFAMRELTAGEYEDALKRATRVKGDDAAGAVVDMQAEQIMASLVTWRGKPVPTSGADREGFWRALTTRQRNFLTGIFDRLHTVPEQEIGDFFEAAVAAKTAKEKPKA
jgi:hypothetical protein